MTSIKIRSFHPSIPALLPPYLQKPHRPSQPSVQQYIFIDCTKGEAFKFAAPYVCSLQKTLKLVLLVSLVSLDTCEQLWTPRC